MKHVTIRAMQDDDVPFVRSSWLRSYRGSKSTHGIANTEYYFGHGALVDALLAKESTAVAVHSQVREELLGWCCTAIDEYGRLIVHYVYVKRPYRRLGVAKHLLWSFGWEPDAETIATHRTWVNTDLALVAPTVYDPYMLFRRLQA